MTLFHPPFELLSMANYKPQLGTRNLAIRNLVYLLGRGSQDNTDAELLMLTSATRQWSVIL